MSTGITKKILLVKKKDSKNGSLWHTFANRRIIKQHGGFDIPEGDLHAVQRYHSPIESAGASPEETNATLSDIEREIQELKEKDKRSSLPQKTAPNNTDDYFDYED